MFKKIRLINGLKKGCLIALGAILLNGAVVYGAGCNTSPFISIVLPRQGSVLCEGKSYAIRWISRNVNRVCIGVQIGGHDAGTLGGCRVDAKKGKYVWHIPKGFVSGFGVSSAKVKIYVCNGNESYCRSREVVIKSVCVNPIHLKKSKLDFQ